MKPESRIGHFVDDQGNIHSQMGVKSEGPAGTYWRVGSSQYIAESDFHENILPALRIALRYAEERLKKMSEEVEGLRREIARAEAM